MGVTYDDEKIPAAVVPSFATPSIVLGIAASAGAASTVIRSDATIIAFDTTAPTTSAVGDAAATGSIAFAARRDHTHGREAFATPVATGTANANGSASTIPRSDHVHLQGIVTTAGDLLTFNATVPARQAIGSNYQLLKTDTAQATKMKWATASVFDAADYGAVGDGSTDDTTALQAAINAATTNGGIVQLLPLTYKITAALTIKSNVLLRGCGYKSIIRQVTSNTDGIVAAGSASTVTRDFGIGNLTIQSGVATAGKAINLGSSRAVRINDIWIEGQTQNTHRWHFGIYLYDTSTSNLASGDIQVDAFRIRDISSTSTNCGVYVNVGTTSNFFDGGYGNVRFNGGFIGGEHYEDDTAITQLPDAGIILEGGNNVFITNVNVVYVRDGIIATPSSNAASYYYQATVSGLSYVKIIGCQVWLDFTSGSQALRMRGAHASFNVLNCSLVTFSNSGSVIDIDTGHTSDVYNSVYFDNCNLNGPIRISNSSAVAEDSMGPIGFGPTNNYHGATSGFIINSAPHKIRIMGGEIWDATTGLSTSASSTALNFQMIGTRFYGCTTNVSWGNTGALTNAIIRDCLPVTVNDLPYYEGPRTYTTSFPTLYSMSAALTLDFANAVMIGYSMSPTVTYKQAGFSFGMGYGFYHGATYVNSGAVNPGPVNGFADAATVNADTTSRTLGQYVSFFGVPAFGRTNAGTLTVTAGYGFFLQPIVNAGATVTTWRSIYIPDTTPGGTITTFVGLEIAALTGGGSNFGIRNADRSVQTKYARFGALTAPTNVTDGDLTAIRILAGNATLASGVVFAASSHSTIGGYLQVGLITAPSNTTAGDLTSKRFRTGTTDATFTTGVTAAEFIGRNRQGGTDIWNDVANITTIANITAPATGDLRLYTYASATKQITLWAKDENSFHSSMVLRQRLGAPFFPYWIGTTTTVSLAATGSPTQVPCGLIYLVAPMNIKGVEYNIGVGANGTNIRLRFALYSEDGQNKLIDVQDTAGDTNGSTGLKKMTISSVILPAGAYYVALGCSVNAQTSQPTLTVCNNESTFNAVASEPAFSGTIPWTTGAAVASFDPATNNSSNLTQSNNKIPYIRLLGNTLST